MPSVSHKQKVVGHVFGLGGSSKIVEKTPGERMKELRQPRAIPQAAGETGESHLESLASLKAQSPVPARNKLVGQYEKGGNPLHYHTHKEGKQVPHKGKCNKRK